MSVPQVFPSFEGCNLISFLPAVLKENKSGWLIEYYATHPISGKLLRKQIRLKHIVKRYKSIRDARNHCNRMVVILNSKLAGGWNPFFKHEDSRMYEKFDTVTRLFIAEKTKELRPNTMRSYTSVTSMLSSWISKSYPNLVFSLFTKMTAVRYMDYIYNNRNAGIRTYNNHIKFGRAFFNWAKERGYTKENPFESIKLKPKHQKQRVIIPPEVRQQITAYFSKHHPNFLIVCKLIHVALIRPNEIYNLKIKDVFLDKRYIRISSEFAKNHKTRYATISKEIIDNLRSLNLEKYPGDNYLFGHLLQQTKEQSGDTYFWKLWNKMRKDLHLPQEMQLYSLRDTGIFEMLKSGIDDLSVMQHADHSSLDITTIYANHVDPKLNELIYSRAPQF